MPFLPDFSDGFIADNILRGLRRCEAATLLRLKKDGFIIPMAIYPALDNRSLLYKGIEVYADVTGLPLSYFFFGTNTAPTPTYTPFDRMVIALLDAMSDNQLRAMKLACDDFFPNLMVAFEATNPNKRLIQLLKQIPYGMRLDFPIAPYKKITKDIRSALSRNSNDGIKWFPSELFPDLATYVGVSLHWIFGFSKHPLFCKTLIADQIFSHYTLLQPEQWGEFISVAQCILCGDLTPYFDLLRGDNDGIA